MGDSRVPSQSRTSVAGKRRSKMSRMLLPHLSNTYRLNPIIKFNPTVAYNVLLEKVPPVFDKIVEYDYDDLATLCKCVSVDVLRSMNDLSLPGYKIVVVVQCVEKADATARGTVRYYWNSQFDGLVTYTHKTDYYYVIVTAAFLYYE